MFKEGDPVLLQAKRYRKGTSSKLQPKYYGPYRVTRAYENRTYLLDQAGKLVQVNEDRLKLHRPTNVAWGAAAKQTEPNQQPPRMGGQLHRSRTAVPRSPEEREPFEIPPLEPESLTSDTDGPLGGGPETPTSPTAREPPLDQEAANPMRVPMDATPKSPGVATRANRTRALPAYLADYELNNIQISRIQILPEEATRIIMGKVEPVGSGNTLTKGDAPDCETQGHIKNAQTQGHPESKSVNPSQTPSRRQKDNTVSNAQLEIPLRRPKVKSQRKTPLRRPVIEHATPTVDIIRSHRFGDTQYGGHE